MLTNMYPPMFMNFMLVNIFTGVIFSVSIILNWKNSILIKRLKANRTELTTLNFVILLIFVPIILISILISILFYYFLSTFGVRSSAFSGITAFLQMSFGNFSTYTYILSFFVYFILSVFLMTVNLLVIFNLKNNGVIRSVLYLWIILSIVFGETIFNTQTSSTWAWYRYIGYLSPTRYFAWFLLFINSYANIDSMGLTQIIDGIFGTASFNSMWVPSMISILFTTILIALTLTNIKEWGMSKWKKSQ